MQRAANALPRIQIVVHVSRQVLRRCPGAVSTQLRTVFCSCVCVCVKREHATSQKTALFHFSTRYIRQAPAGAMAHPWTGIRRIQCMRWDPLPSDRSARNDPMNGATHHNMQHLLRIYSRACVCVALRPVKLHLSGASAPWCASLSVAFHYGDDESTSDTPPPPPPST
jgi:hypothetical protein